MRVTIICPEAHCEDANQLAMVLGYGAADALTYGGANWQDEAGNRYAVASLDVAPAFIDAAQATLARPMWDEENSDDDGVGYQVNMAGAARAQALVSIWGLRLGLIENEVEPDPVASPATILALFHDKPMVALEMVGVSRIEQGTA